MATTTLRVHTLAKELNVPSKVIIEKCAAEGIELKNHMAAISVGLAESIREWFSAGADITSVETAAPVELERVRVPRRKKKVEPAEAQPTAPDAAEVAPAPVTVPAEPEVQAPAPAVEAPEAVPVAMPVEAPPAEVAIPAVVEPAPIPATPAEAPPEVARIAALAPTVEVPPGPAEPAPVPVEVPLAPEPPAEAPPVITAPVPPPEPIRPAGPQLIPRPAELQGPRVVRVEAPEPTTFPRPRPPSFAPRGPGGGVAASAAPPSTTARRGRGRGRKEDTEAEAARNRSRSPRRRGGLLDIEAREREWRDQDLLERKERLASVTGHGLRDRRAAERRRQATAQTLPGAPPRKELVTITTPITLKEFCAVVGVGFVVVSKKLTEATGRLWTINQSIDTEQVELLAAELGLQFNIAARKTGYEALEAEFDSRERKNLRARPPVVAMLGHVDHGKTSLLDAIRHAHVAAGEAGGITQHIGAYRIDHGDWHVTFVDTPGHQAFTAMRARGAHLTDVVVLVVAADDGVMPQTVEAMNHARAAGVPIVVALNKIDLPGIDLNRVYAQLAERDLTPSEWGGQTDVIKTSATTGEGIDALVAHLSTLSELMELRADPDVPALATVIEAQMREGQGIVAQVLVREGTLRPGQIVVCGPGAGRVRALLDDRGKPVKEAAPGTPVEVSGLDELPQAGDQLYQVDSLSRAKEIAEEVGQQRRVAALQTAAPKARTLEALMAGGIETEVPTLNAIVKADVQGSVEVLKKTLASFPADKAKLNLLHAAVGAVSEADVSLAKASGAIIIGFHVVAEDRARQLAEQLGVQIRLYRVIYEILDDLQKALLGLLEPEHKEEQRATLEVRQIFHVSRVGTIAGCYVTDGTIHRNHKVRVVRDGRIVLEGAPIDSLKRFKDDAREVRAGLECGVKLAGFDDIKPGDILQSFEMVEVPQEL